MNWSVWKRPLLISAVLAVALAVMAWYYDPIFAAMLCLLAVLIQLVRLLYYLLRWNKSGLAASGMRLAIWVAAMAAAIGAHDHYSSGARVEGEALVAALKAYRAREGRHPPTLDALAPRDIAKIPAVPSPPGSTRKFHYRLAGEHFQLMYVTGMRMGAVFDSENGKWEELD